MLKIEVYDDDYEEESELIGLFECYLNKLLTANKQTIKGDLVMPENSGGNRGRIILKADSVENSNHQAVIETEIHILDPKKKK